MNKFIQPILLFLNIRVLFIIIFFTLFSLNIHAEFRSTVFVPIEKIPNPQSSDNIDTLINKLKAYIIAGEDLANKFEKLENQYASVITLYTNYKAKCINMAVYQSPLFKHAQNAAIICHPDTKSLFKQHLNKMNKKLQSNSKDLLLIKVKLNDASQLIINLADSQALNSEIDKLEKQVNQAENYHQKLKALEAENQ